MYKKVLVPYDDSEHAKNALRNALDLVRGTDGEITVLNVVEWRDYNAETFKIASRMAGVAVDDLDMGAIGTLNDTAEREEITRLEQSIAELVGADDRVSVAVVNGSPHDSIVDFARDNDFDCIAMGHRGMGVIRGMLGSVCYSVLQKATVPVLVVK
ncbi:universal stress protein [Adlercreutzia murintestinalis]|uniref:universal stress protein n=1 Tax=Adlercreutzia murintestinalis TaxID=2941325 RepID=UPI0020406C99|nr:universal stress protein [Adlercreutzia murintestinalis]